MNNTYVRALEECDKEQVLKLDELSRSCLAEYLDCNNYVWGIFNSNNELLGYCTLGGADDSTLGYSFYSYWTKDSLVLCDVFIKEDNRRKGLAIEMIKEVLKNANPDRESVFLTIVTDKLRRLYEKVGFKYIKDGCMVWVDDKLKHTIDTLMYLEN